MEKYVTIILTEKEYDAVLKINARYYFDLFKEIRADEEEEFAFRDALNAISQKIEEKKK